MMRPLPPSDFRAALWSLSLPLHSKCSSDFQLQQKRMEGMQENPLGMQAAQDGDANPQHYHGVAMRPFPGVSRLQQPEPDAASDADPARPQSPNEQDLLVTRLIARIAELEEKLYQRELAAPTVPGASLEVALSQQSHHRARSAVPELMLACEHQGVSAPVMMLAVAPPAPTHRAANPCSLRPCT